MKNDKLKKEKWERIISKCQASGHSIKSYCQESGISYAQYQYWASILRTAKNAPVSRVADTKPAKSLFVPIELEPEQVASPLPELFLRVGGYEVLIRRSSCAA